MMMIMDVVIIVDDKPEADGSTVVCVKRVKEQLLHVTGLPDLDHDYFDDDDDDDDCECDDDDNDCDV